MSYTGLDEALIRSIEFWSILAVTILPYIYVLSCKNYPSRLEKKNLKACNLLFILKARIEKRATIFLLLPCRENVLVEKQIFIYDVTISLMTINWLLELYSTLSARYFYIQLYHSGAISGFKPCHIFLDLLLATVLAFLATVSQFYTTCAAFGASVGLLLEHCRALVSS